MLRQARQRDVVDGVVVLRHRDVAVGVGIVGIDAETIERRGQEGEGLLVQHLEASDIASLAIDRLAERARRRRAVHIDDDLGDLGDDVGLQILVEGRNREGRIGPEIPFVGQVELVGAERFQQRIAPERLRGSEHEDAEAGVQIVEWRPRDGLGCCQSDLLTLGDLPGQVQRRQGVGKAVGDGDGRQHHRPAGLVALIDPRAGRGGFRLDDPHPDIACQITAEEGCFEIDIGIGGPRLLLDFPAGAAIEV